MEDFDGPTEEFSKPNIKEEVRTEGTENNGEMSAESSSVKIQLKGV